MSKFVMIIFGASGDLTKRKLIPALYNLYKDNRLPEGFAVLGIGRTGYRDDTYRTYIRTEMERFVASEEHAGGRMTDFCNHLYYLSLNPAEAADYGNLDARLRELTGEQEPDGMLYYLATPPSLYGVIPLHLKTARLNRPHTRIIVEKPFGYDLESARELNRIYASVFEEHQIYGALRDMVQNHLIQLVALTAMEPPAVFNADNFRNEVVKVYESLSPLTEEDLNEHIVRGQYTASATKPGYREEKNVASDSRTETYIAMKIGIDNWRWSGVPFYIRTGKQMPTKVTEIVVHFRETPHQMFRCEGGHCPRANKLILRLQPNEGIVLKFGMKVPGPGFDVKQVMMDFSYSDLGGLPAGDAYARLIEDCIQGDQTLFTRSDAVDASWRFFNPVLKYWQEHPDAPLYGYPVGTWGPLESEAMMREHGAEWTNPCKNLTNTDEYCEL